MALPQSVQQAADYADSIEKTILDGGAEQPKVQENPGITPTDVVTEQQAVAPVEENQSDELKKYKDRYRSLQGKYNAEVPSLHEENRSLRDQLARLQEENKAARELLNKHESEKSYLTEQDVDTFGADMIDMSKRAAAEATKEQARRQAMLENEIAELKQQLSATRQESEKAARAEFERQIGTVCPEWVDLNTDQGFNDWLDEEDPNYGVQRKLALGNAVRNRDGIRAGRIFKMYADSIKRPHDPLARQVTPDHKAAAPAPQHARRWKESDVVRFFRDAQSGRIPRDQAEKIEQEINEAVAAGQVIMGM